MRGSAPPRAPADPHRRAAEAVLAAGGSVTVLTALGEETVSKLADLPSEPFAAWTIEVFNSPIPLSGLIDAIAPIQRSLDALVIDRTDGQVTQLSNRDVEKLSDLNCRVVSLNKINLTDACAKSLAGWRGVSELQLSYTGVGDDVCRVLATWPGLVSLNLGQTGVTDDGIKALEYCRVLNALNLASCPSITEKGLASIQRMPRLRFLDLRSTNLGDEIIDALAAASQLRHIELQNTRVSDAGLRRLQSRLPRTYINHPAAELPSAEQELVRWALEQQARVRLGDRSQAKSDEPVRLPAETIDFAAGSLPASEAGKFAQARSLRSLIWPDLASADEAMAHVSRIDSLLSLSIEKSDVSGEGLARLSALTSLGQLSLSSNPRLDDNALRQFPQLPSLWRLGFDSCPITGPGLEHLRQAPQLQILSLGATPLESDELRHLIPLKHLRFLNVASTPIDDAAVPHLSQCTSLRRLRVRDTEITKHGIDQLHQALPHCTIQWDGPLVRPEILQIALPDSQPAANWDLGKAPNPAPALHRRAAETVLAAGGTVSVMTAESGKTVGKLADLPNEPFAVWRIDVLNSQSPLSGVIDAIAPIQHSLDTLIITRTDDGVTYLSERDLEKLRHLNCRVISLTKTTVTDACAQSLAAWQSVREIQLSLTDAGDEICRVLARWPVLATLNLNRTAVTDEGLKALEDCPLLNSLSLGDCQAITEQGLASLARMPQLRVVSLNDTNFGDAVVDVLAAARQLRYVKLQATRISDASARRLQSALPQTYIDHPAIERPAVEKELIHWALEQKARVRLTDLSHAKSGEPITLPAETIAFTAGSPPANEAERLAQARFLQYLTWPDLTPGADEALAHLAKLGSLKALNLNKSDLSGEGLARLSPLASLQSLILSSNQPIGDKALGQLPDLPCLSNLGLAACPVTGPGLEHLQRAPRLQSLSLQNVPLESDGLRHLIPLRHLRFLNVASTPIDDAAAPHLTQCTSLRRLSMRGTKITKSGIDQLHQALPHCIIQWDGGLVLPEPQAGGKS